MLPEAFGSVHIGEGFECIICVNNELPAPGSGGSGSGSRRVTSVKLSATMQTPSTSLPLDLDPPPDAATKDGLPAGGSVQAVLRCDIREEGAFQLAVNVSYYEALGTAAEPTATTGGRARSFRKLYNFAATPALSVRTKSTPLPPVPLSTSGGGDGDDGAVFGAGHDRERYALECQLENLASGVLCVEKLAFEASACFRAVSANWDAARGDGEMASHVVAPVLNPHEVSQVAFLLEEKPVREWGGAAKERTRDGRTVLGALTIHWRTAMGQAAVLSTGWLTSRKR